MIIHSDSVNYSATDLNNYRNMFSKAAQGPGIHEKAMYQVKRVVVITIENRLNIRLFIPHSSGKNDLNSTILWFHGGGFILGGTLEDSLKCRILANTTNSVVASVEYRLAPENPFPAAIEDAELALTWLLTENSLKNYGNLLFYFYISFIFTRPAYFQVVIIRTLLLLVKVLVAILQQH